MAQEQEWQTLSGTVENIVYCNEENGYTVLEFSSGETFTPRWASFRM